jgi:hypothetical protein
MVGEAGISPTLSKFTVYIRSIPNTHYQKENNVLSYVSPPYYFLTGKV